MYHTGVPDRTLGLAHQCEAPRGGKSDVNDSGVLSSVRALSLNNQIEGLSLHVHYPVRVPASEVK